MTVTQVVNPPPRERSSLEKTKDKAYNCLKDEKVKQVAIGLFSVIIGAGIGALIGTAFGATPIILGAAAGAIVGGFTYAAVTLALHIIKTNGYPAHHYVTEKPISTFRDWGTDDHLDVFKDVIKDFFKEIPWFIEWKKLKKFEKEDDAAEYLFGKFIHQGFSFGEAKTLLSLSKKYVDLKGHEFLRKVRAEPLFLHQVAEWVRQDLISNTKARDLRKKVEEDLDTVLGLETAGKLKIDFKHLETFKETIKTKLGKNLIGATLKLNGKDGHTLYISLKKPYRFYDPFSKRFGGLHEFKTEQRFIDKLHDHLKHYTSPYRFSKKREKGVLKFYRLK